MKVKFEIFEIPGAPIEGVSPLPKFRARKPVYAATSEDFPESLKEGLAYLPKPLPYTMQDRYKRGRDILKLKSFVLENEYLVARFLPEYGGRLHSLYDKRAGRDLLFTNPVIQPGNLATRNAWLSGGIEWNIGNHGHTYTTCDNVFAAILTAPDGNEFVRIYEFERNKSIFWQVDFHLPDGSPYLISHVKMVNPFPVDTTTYWWSNIAVPTDEHTRVIASNKKVISFVGGTCHYDTLPVISSFDGIDPTYPNNAPRAFDYFIQKDEDGESTWEAAAYDDGLVFYERSTAPLYYKKLFCWGNHRAGRHWQEFLSDGKGTGYYAELQAGIAPSQLHDKHFPANSKYEWTQCFGGIKLDTGSMFGDYDEACDTFGKALDEVLSEAVVNALNEKYSEYADIPVTRESLKNLGTGFGALEIKRMNIDGDAKAPAQLLFPEETIGEVEAPWLALLECGRLPETSARELLSSFMTSEKWLPRIKRAAESADASWAELMHYGIAAYEYQDTRVYVGEATGEALEREQTEVARAAWERSLETCENVWALRNLAVLAERAGDECAAMGYYDRALKVEGAYDDYALASEYLTYLIKIRQYAKAWEIYENLPENCKGEDRVRITVSMAAVKLDKIDYLDAFFTEPHHAIREGENSLTDVWFEYSARKLARERGITDLTAAVLESLIDEAWDSCPPDYSIDFRMSLNRQIKYRV